MEKKIKYELDESRMCITPCPNVCGYANFGTARVGSINCHLCNYYINDDKKTQTVTCNHPNNKPDKNKDDE
jgi:hypothetical protein